METQSENGGMKTKLFLSSLSNWNPIFHDFLSSFSMLEKAKGIFGHGEGSGCHKNYLYYLFQNCCDCLSQISVWNHFVAYGRKYLQLQMGTILYKMEKSVYVLQDIAKLNNFEQLNRYCTTPLENIFMIQLVKSCNFSQAFCLIGHQHAPWSYGCMLMMQCSKPLKCILVSFQQVQRNQNKNLVLWNELIKVELPPWKI